MNCDEEKEDLDRLRWFGGIEKSANVVSLWFFFPCPFHRGLCGLPSVGSLLPKSHLEIWEWPQGNPQWALGLAPRLSRTGERGLVTETHNHCSHDPTECRGTLWSYEILKGKRLSVKFKWDCFCCIPANMLIHHRMSGLDGSTGKGG